MSSRKSRARRAPGQSSRPAIKPVTTPAAGPAVQTVDTVDRVLIDGEGVTACVERAEVRGRLERAFAALVSVDADAAAHRGDVDRMDIRAASCVLDAALAAAEGLYDEDSLDGVLVRIARWSTGMAAASLPLFYGADRDRRQALASDKQQRQRDIWDAVKSDIDRHDAEFTAHLAAVGDLTPAADHTDQTEEVTGDDDQDR